MSIGWTPTSYKLDNQTLCEFVSRLRSH